MKRMLFLAAVPALLLSACASVETATTAVGDNSTQYCWKDNLIESGAGLTCNWNSNRGTACETTNKSTIAKSAVATGPEASGRCNNGQWLMRVTTK